MLSGTDQGETVIKKINTHCLNCKYYKIQDAETGLCRVEVLTAGNRDGQKPRVQADNSCSKWVNCGQGYYVRLGWIKNLNNNSDKK